MSLNKSMISKPIHPTCSKLIIFYNFLREYIKMLTPIDYTTVTHLDLSGQNLFNLPDDLHLYTNLTHLDVSNNRIKFLVTLPNTLIEFNCSNNKLTLIDHQLPHGLRILNCSDNCLSFMQYMPDTLIELNCSDNLISQLDHLPFGLVRLDCSNTTRLYTRQNCIKFLCHLPGTLRYLNCSNNCLRNLDDLPQALDEVIYDGNPLTHFPILFPPNSDYVLK
jgi:Leucine-rich repeat (LRR) protein